MIIDICMLGQPCKFAIFSDYPNWNTGVSELLFNIANIIQHSEFS